MRSMWLSADITLSAMTTPLAMAKSASERERSPTAGRTQLPGMRLDASRRGSIRVAAVTHGAGQALRRRDQVRENTRRRRITNPEIALAPTLPFLLLPASSAQIPKFRREERMVLGTRIVLAASMVSIAVCSLAPSVSAQQPRVGVVTNVEGPATVARVALPEPQPLRFKDDVFLKDRITTGDRAIVRVLLGGKATVTARERSVLTITEAPGVSTVELSSGRISVAVSKAKMKPGEIVEIRTPNAVTAVRGTVVIAEVWPGRTVRSTITVLRGLDVTRLDNGTRQTVGTAVDVAANQTITVTGASPLSRPTTITADEANRLAAEFRMLPSTAPAASAAPAVQMAVQRAAGDAEAIVAASTAAAAAGSATSINRARGGSDGG